MSIPIYRCRKQTWLLKGKVGAQKLPDLVNNSLVFCGGSSILAASKKNLHSLNQPSILILTAGMWKGISSSGITKLSPAAAPSLPLSQKNYSTGLTPTPLTWKIRKMPCTH